MVRSALIIVFLVSAAACSCPEAATPVPQGIRHTPRSNDVVISIVGTNDLHGRIARLPILAGYIENLRAVRQAPNGGVVVIDGGDMFQGTLESNLSEGGPVIEAYNAIGYTAATIGNHEFDFGPVGEHAVPQKPGDDPLGAIKARARQAKFPLLTANILAKGQASRPNWPMRPTLLTRVSGVTIGVIGITTIDTPYTTMSANFINLAMAPLAATVTRYAADLRDRGAEIVIVAAHAGAKCDRFDDPDDLSSCTQDAEIFKVARALPHRGVDAIVAGHTHAGVAHRVNGIPIIESGAKGRYFGRIDLTVAKNGSVTHARLFPPKSLCSHPNAPHSDCDAGQYEGRRVVPDKRISALIANSLTRANSVRAQLLGVTIETRVKRSRTMESPLGNLFADLMLAGHPSADIALTNGGGLRADLPRGMLTYGALYEAAPFDNRFATVTLTGGDLQRLVAHNLQKDRGIISLAGIRAQAVCADGDLRVSLFRASGKRVGANERLVMATSDFLASGGDGMIGRLGLPEGSVILESGEPIRDIMANILRKRGGIIRGDELGLFDPNNRRLQYPGTRPVTCEAN